jgi:hypothetical protein
MNDLRIPDRAYSIMDGASSEIAGLRGAARIIVAAELRRLVILYAGRGKVRASDLLARADELDPPGGTP